VKELGPGEINPTSDTTSSSSAAAAANVSGSSVAMAQKRDLAVLRNANVYISHIAALTSGFCVPWLTLPLPKNTKLCLAWQS